MILFDAHPGSVLAIGFSPQGDRLFTSGKDATLKLWSPPILVQEFPTDKKEVHTFAFSSTGELAAYAGSDRRIHICRSDGVHLILPPQTLDITGLAFVQNDETLAVSLGNRMENTQHPRPLFLWDIAGKKVKPFHPGLNAGIRSLSVHPTKRYLAWANDAGSILVRDLTKPVMVFDKKLKIPARRVQLSPDGKQIAIAFGWLCEIDTFERRHEPLVLTAHKGVVTGIAFTPDGSRLLTGSWDQTVKIWDVLTGKELASYDWGVGRVVDLCVASDGLRAAVGGDSGRVAVWDLDG